jgi:hypothetical protein
MRKVICLENVFEYLATGLPILGTGPENGDAAMMLKETGAGAMFDDSEKEKIKATLLSLYQAWKGGNGSVTSRADTKYSRREITRQLTEYL